jgi:hypothetical protein
MIRYEEIEGERRRSGGSGEAALHPENSLDAP